MKKLFLFTLILLLGNIVTYSSERGEDYYRQNGYQVFPKYNLAIKAPIILQDISYKTKHDFDAEYFGIENENIPSKVAVYQLIIIRLPVSFKGFSNQDKKTFTVSFLKGMLKDFPTAKLVKFSHEELDASVGTYKHEGYDAKFLYFVKEGLVFGLTVITNDNLEARFNKLTNSVHFFENQVSQKSVIDPRQTGTQGLSGLQGLSIPQPPPVDPNEDPIARTLRESGIVIRNPYKEHYDNLPDVVKWEMANPIRNLQEGLIRRNAEMMPGNIPSDYIGVPGFGDSHLDKNIRGINDLYDLDEFRAQVQPWYTDVDTCILFTIIAIIVIVIIVSIIKKTKGNINQGKNKKNNNFEIIESPVLIQEDSVKKYYIVKKGKQEGPYTMEELREKPLTRDSIVWYKGLPNWTKLSEIEDLKSLYEEIPPPIMNTEL